jgi:tetratricopeptide (TPR) repeat protein
MKKNLMKKIVLAVLLSGASLAASANNAWEQSLQAEAKGDYVSAAALIEPLLQTGDQKEFAALRVGWLNYLQGRYDAATAAYRKALLLNPQSVDARLGLTLPLLAQAHWQEAETVLKQLLTASAWDYTAHVRLMVAEEGQQKWEVLARHASDLNRRYPSDATALVYLARAQAWLGRTEKAKNAYQQVLVRIPAHAEASYYLQAH